jgi:hypothetical protein
MYRSNRGGKSTPKASHVVVCLFLMPTSVLSCRVLRQGTGTSIRRGRSYRKHMAQHSFKGAVPLTVPMLAHRLGFHGTIQIQFLLRLAEENEDNGEEEAQRQYSTQSTEVMAAVLDDDYPWLQPWLQGKRVKPRKKNYFRPVTTKRLLSRPDSIS